MCGFTGGFELIIILPSLILFLNFYKITLLFLHEHQLFSRCLSTIVFAAVDIDFDPTLGTASLPLSFSRGFQSIVRL